MHAIRIVRSHEMDDAQLQLVYRSVVIAKLTYASSSCWEFTTASDRQRFEGFFVAVVYRICTQLTNPQ